MVEKIILIVTAEATLVKPLKRKFAYKKGF